VNLQLVDLALRAVEAFGSKYLQYCTIFLWCNYVLNAPSSIDLINENVDAVAFAAIPSG
jgi:hypothetical protein